MNIGKSIRIAMEMTELDSRALALKLGVRYSYARQLRHRADSTTKTIKKLSKAFGMKASDFIALGEKSHGWDTATQTAPIMVLNEETGVIFPLIGMESYRWTV